MPAKEKVYPEWVQAYRTRGNTVKKKGDSYYLYKRTSKRIPGKKYPQPVDTYIGVITPEGVVKSDRKQIDLTDICVREYGFSRTIREICPEGWKQALGKDWEDILDIILLKWSPETYRQDEKKIRQEEEFHVQIQAQMSSLIRRIYKQYHVDKEDLETLKGIYLVTSGKIRAISRILPQQQEILDKLEIRIEVD